MKEMTNPSRNLASKGLRNGSRGKTGLAKNNDFVEDLPLGDMTNMNTIEYKYYGFYHRIRQKLEQYWGRNLREKARPYTLQGEGCLLAKIKSLLFVLLLMKQGRLSMFT